MRVAVDVDGVISNTFPIIEQRIREKGKILERTNQYHPVIHGVSNSKQFMGDIISHILSDQSVIEPYEDTYFIPTIDKYLGTITFVTARRERFNDETLKWLNKTFPSLSYSLINKSSKHKVEFIKKEGFDLFIEDRLRTANQAAEAGINIFLVNRYWNLGRFTHEKVIRVGDLGTFYSIAVSKFKK